ncbi:MAG: DUF6441 family protein [Limimaricola soesokkakensis]|uniref:DUF6441 family protein n=1 Tax=Limimaricola soesokkakensis TaxID=1343159 RepID=UPI004057F7D5
MKGRAEYQRGAFLDAFMSAEKPIAVAATSAVREAAAGVKAEARSQIASAGFGRKWQNVLRVDAYPRGGISINAAAHVYHKIPYAWVFEEGAKISGKPLLWIPLPHVAKKIGRKKLTPKSYPGELQSVNRPGKPPLLMAQVRVSKAAARRSKAPKLTAAAMKRGTSGSGLLRSVPVFVGVDVVKLGRKFDVSGVTAKAAADLGRLYMKHLEVDE